MEMIVVGLILIIINMALLISFLVEFSRTRDISSICIMVYLIVQIFYIIVAMR